MKANATTKIGTQNWSNARLEDLKGLTFLGFFWKIPIRRRIYSLQATCTNYNAIITLSWTSSLRTKTWIQFNELLKSRISIEKLIPQTFLNCFERLNFAVKLLFLAWSTVDHPLLRQINRLPFQSTKTLKLARDGINLIKKRSLLSINQHLVRKGTLINVYWAAWIMPYKCNGNHDRHPDGYCPSASSRVCSSSVSPYKATSIIMEDLQWSSSKRPVHLCDFVWR